MAYITDEKELYKLYTSSKSESDEWREDYHEYERLADNGLLENLDPTLPETNDGTLSASLYKLPKRIIKASIKGRATATDRDDAWLTELANIRWEKKIIPNANSQAPFIRKWKDAVRKSAIYGSVPLITLFVERGNYTGADFIVAQPQDVTLEAGKVSDYDSDVIFWDVYYSKSQVEALIEQAKDEDADYKKEKEQYDITKAEAKTNGVEFDEDEPEPYNKWFIAELKEILTTEPDDERSPDDDHRDRDGKDVKQKGYKFCIAFQRGVNAPFRMYYKNTKKTVREWSNPDPTGDVPVHFLYCYQDFINPYGVGIVKLAGGTQNVLDNARQVDVLATQLGFRPPVAVSGDSEGADLDSIVYEQDAIWELGNATVQRQEISNQIYQSLPTRIQMYKQSLNNILPMGDTSISAGAGDPLASKTHAGVKLAEANLSIDDEDFKDNVDMTYAAVAKSMINTDFANMQGSDLMKLSDEERELLIKGGMEWPTDEDGELVETNELEILWDEVRANFDYEIDPDNDKAKDDEKRLEGLMKVLELKATDPTLEQSLMMAGKKLNVGELMGSIISLTTDNEKILQDITPEEEEANNQQMMQQQAMAEQGMAEQPGELPPEQMQAEQGMTEQMPQEQPVEQQPQEDKSEEIEALMQGFGVSQGTALAMLEAEAQGFDQEEILKAVERAGELVNA